MVDRYYDGTATPDDIKSLRLFDEAGMVPDSLADDVRLIGLISEAGAQTGSDADVPDGLYASLVDMIDRAGDETHGEVNGAVKPHSGWIRRFVWAASAAAAVIVVAMVAPRLLNGSADVATVPGAELTANVPAPVLADTVAAAPAQPSLIVSEATASVSAPAVDAVKVRNVSRVDEPIAGDDDSDDPYLNVTDSVEAARIAAEVMMLLASNIETATGSVAQSTASISNFGNTFNSIMQ